MSGEDAEPDWSQVRQGDVVALDGLPALVDGEATLLPSPQGVVVVSQTCDVVQSSKSMVTVAPLLSKPTKEQISSAKKGRSPMLLYLPPVEECGERIADMSKTSAVPKAEVVSTSPLSRHTRDEYGPSSRQLAERIGRVYSRFAFPDVVHGSLSKFLETVRDKALGYGNLGPALDFVEEFRVAANHWEGSGRELKIYVVVPARVLPPEDDFTEALSDDPIKGLNPGENLGVVPPDRISQLLADECERVEKGKDPGGAAVLLWQAWCAALQRQYLDPRVNKEIVLFEVEPIGAGEFTYEQMKATEPLDLETLSDSTSVAENRP